MERNPANGKDLFKALKNQGLNTEYGCGNNREIKPTLESYTNDKVDFTENSGGINLSSSGAFYSMKNKKEGIIKGVRAPLSTSNEGVENIVPADFIKKSLFENVAVLNYFGVLKDLLSLYVVNGLDDSVMRTVPSEVVREVRSIIREFEGKLF